MLAPDKIRELYRQGKRRFKSDDIWFKIKKGGPDNNYLTVYPEDPRRLTPVLNMAYDVAKESRIMEARRTKESLPRMRPRKSS